MENAIIQKVYHWIRKEKQYNQFYCQSRDIFQARLERMQKELARTDENMSYLISAISGEIGNNSYDHNMGQWKDIPGIFFGYDLDEKTIALADRGQGIKTTLQKIIPSIQNAREALQIAFTKKVSGRSPEQRGNGLKFVNQTVCKTHLHLLFRSGNAQIELNKEMRLEETDEIIQGCLAIINF